jgi:hypothetical protein
MAPRLRTDTGRELAGVAAELAQLAGVAWPGDT